MTIIETVEQWLDLLDSASIPVFTVSSFASWMAGRGYRFGTPPGLMLQDYKRVQAQGRTRHLIRCGVLGPNATWTIVQDAAEAWTDMDNLAANIATRAANEFSHVAVPVAAMDPLTLPNTLLLEAMLTGVLTAWAAAVRAGGNGGGATPTPVP